jgi:hypothetical protein
LKATTGWVCILDCANKEYMQNSDGKISREMDTGRTKEDSIKMILKETGCDGGRLMAITGDRIKF